jgi:hypothetical protein
MSKPRAIPVSAALLALSLTTTSTQASLVISTTSDVNTLTQALLQPNSGINILSSKLISGSGAMQQGTYTGFNLAPSSGNTPTLAIEKGVVLSTGFADMSGNNISLDASIAYGSPGYVALTTLAQTFKPGVKTLDANVLEYTFSLSAGLDAISLDFLFGTEELPSQGVNDVFGVFVDGVNYAKFQNGNLIASNNSPDFISNPVNQGLYAIEYNSLTPKLSLTGRVDTSLSTHTLTLGIVDTFDGNYDSGVYLANLRGVNSTSNAVPEPGSLALLAASCIGWGLARRKTKA